MLVICLLARDSAWGLVIRTSRHFSNSTLLVPLPLPPPWSRLRATCTDSVIPSPLPRTSSGLGGEIGSNQNQTWWPHSLTCAAKIPSPPKIGVLKNCQMIPEVRRSWNLTLFTPENMEMSFVTFQTFWSADILINKNSGIYLIFIFLTFSSLFFIVFNWKVLIDALSGIHVFFMSKMPTIV